MAAWMALAGYVAGWLSDCGGDLASVGFWTCWLPSFGLSNISEGVYPRSLTYPTD